MKKHLIVLLCLLASTALAQGPVWHNPHTNDTWPLPIGWISQPFDPISGQTFLWVEQQALSGTVSVTPGSTTVTWVSGPTWENWMPGDGFIADGNTVHFAAVSSKSITLTAPYAGATAGTVSYRAVPGGIFSKAGMWYSATSNNFTVAWDTHSLSDSCPVDLPNLPGDSHRQPSVYDSNRHYMWMGGGVDVNCGQGLVNTSGTAVTLVPGIVGATSAPFPIDGTLTGLHIIINSTSYTVGSVTDQAHLTLTTSAGTQNNAGFSFVGSSSGNPRQDWYYIALQSNPANNVPVQVLPAHFPGPAFSYPAAVYDPDDDVFITRSIGPGSASTVNWIYCSTIPFGGGSPTGTLTSKQIAAGCGGAFGNGADDWSLLCPGSHRDSNASCASFPVHPHGYEHVGMLWDPATKKVILTGGLDTTGSIAYNETWAYDVPSQTWTQKCLSGCTAPPDFVPTGSRVPRPAWAMAGDGKIYFHQGINYAGSQPSDWRYDTVADTWTQVGSGAGASEDSFMSYDSVNNKLVLFANNSDATEMWVGDMPAAAHGAGISVPLTIQELLPIGDAACVDAATCGIARTDEPFRVGVPLPDNTTTGTDTTSVLGLTGCSAGQFRALTHWPSGNIQWLEVQGIVPTLAAGGTTACTLTGAGSGNFGGSPLASISGSTITVATGALTATIKAAGAFNGLDTVTVGSTAIVSTSSAATRGVVVLGPVYPATDCSGGCTTVYSSANDTSSVSVIEENGPVEAVIKTTGALKDSLGNAYLPYTVRDHFWKGKTGVKVHSETINGDDPDGGEFNTAFKGFAEQRLALDIAPSGTKTYTFGGKSTPVTGSFSGSEDATMVQLYSDWLQDNKHYGDPGEWDTGSLPENSTQTIIPRSSAGCTPDIYCYPTSGRAYEGYTVKDGATVLDTGTRSDHTAGWANVQNSSGAGVLTGVWYLSAYWPKSLEFNGGGNNTVIGLWPKQISGFNWWICYACYQISDSFYVFHDTALANNDTEFKKLQYDLTARAPISQYNTAGVLLVGPIPEAAVEDSYYVSLGAAANPVVSSEKMCCVIDESISGSGFDGHPAGPYLFRTYNWGATGGINESETGYNYWVNFITRGTTARYLFAKMRNRFIEEQVLPRSHFAGGWSSKVYPVLITGTGFPFITSDNVNSALQNWKLNGGGFEQHSHIYGLPYAYYATGEEHYADTVKQGYYDWVLNNSPENGNLADLQYPSVPRAIGPKLVFTAVVHDFAAGIGDTTAATGAWATAEAVMNKAVRPVLVSPKTACTSSGCLGAGDYGTDRNRGVISAMAIGQGWDIPISETFGTGNGSARTFVGVVGAPRLPLLGIGGLCGQNSNEPLFQIWAAVTITAGSVVGTDDVSSHCTGEITGTGITSGDVDYATGTIHIVFDVAPANGQVITVRYFVPTPANISVTGVQGGARGSGAFQTSLAAFGVYTYANSRGKSWSGYEDAMDLALGMDQWAANEITKVDNSGTWVNTGIRFGAILDFCNDPLNGSVCQGDPSGHGAWTFPGQGDTPGVSTSWWLWIPQIDYVGDTAWKKVFEANLLRLLNSVSAAPNGFTEYAEWGVSALVYRALNPPNYALLDVPITSFHDNGGGSYTVGWVVPTGLVVPPGYTTPYRFKWGTKHITPFTNLGYDPGETATYALSPSTNQTWFSATNVADEPSPASTGSTQTYTFATGTTGLHVDNFSIKAQQTAFCSIGSSLIAPGSVGQSVSWTFTASGCGEGTLTWTVTGSLPAGTSGCSSTTGSSCTVSGTLTTASTYTPSVHVSDGGSNFATQPISVVVSAPAGSSFGGVGGSRTVSGVTTIKH